MTIALNTTSYNIHAVYHYTAATDTFTKRTTTPHDLFNDNSTVGDAVCFFGIASYNLKYNKLNINVTTPLVADSISVVWEYCKRGSSYSDDQWTELSDVNDGTDAFRNSGSNTVTFSIPEDWSNWVYPNNNTEYYRFTVRCRIVSLTNLTEGGAEGQPTATPYGIRISGNDTVTLPNLYAADVANSWNLVQNIGRLYSIKCNLIIESGSALVMDREILQFEKNWGLYNLGTLTCGSLTGNDGWKGGALIFLGYDMDYSDQYVLQNSNSTLYNITIRIVSLGGTGGTQGFWGTLENATINNSYFEGFRHMSFTNATLAVKNVINSGCHIEGQSAFLDTIKVFGSLHGMRSKSVDSNKFFYRLDFSNVTTAPVNPYTYGNPVTGPKFVDCNFGSFAFSNYCYWTNPGSSTTYIEMCASLLAKIVNINDNPISGALCTLKDKDGNTVWSYYTNDDGYIGVDYGSVTSATSTTLTDNTKNWSTSQWHYREIFITSGSGINQRRGIKASGCTSTTVNLAFAWKTTPPNNSRYIFIPLINWLRLEPVTYGSGSYWSTAIDKRPFTLTVSKTGYKTRTISINPDVGENAITGIITTIVLLPFDYQVTPLIFSR